MKMNLKLFSVLALAIFTMVLVASSAFALDANYLRVEMDDRTLDPSVTNDVSAFEKNDEFEVIVDFSLAGTDNMTDEEIFENVQVEARIRGYDQNDMIDDISDAFNVVEDTKYSEKLTLKLPVRMDDGLYKLRVTISDAYGEEVYQTYNLRVASDSHGIWIKDIVMSPENEVQAGRALLTTVRVKNIGDNDEDEGVRIKVSIPSLGVSATDYIDEIDADESVTSEELYMRIPQCADLGEHNVYVEVTYHDGDDVEEETTSIYVVGGELCEANQPSEPVDNTPVVTAGVDVQNVVAGSGGAIYPVTVTNTASTAKTYTVTADVESWATVRVSPSNVLVVEPGATETVYVYVSAKEDATPGQNLFAVTVKSGSEIVEQFALTANVVAGETVADDADDDSWNSVKRTLEIGLIVLVIILVILGFVIGLKRMRKDDDEGDEAQTYY
jgi:hypothetical protein